MRSVAVAALGLVLAVGQARSAGDATSKKAGLDFAVVGDLVRHEVWGVQVQVPGYEPWDADALEDFRHRPNFVLAAASQGECHLPVTMWVERVPEGTTAEQCRRGFMGNPDAIRKTRDARLSEEEVTPITYTLFDIFLEKGKPTGAVNNQLLGYWVRGDHCFELHVSSINCEGFADHAMRILKSVRISDDTGATLETVALARTGDEDPRDWRLHMKLAGVYQYGPKGDGKGNDRVRARRFYTSALRLGGGAIPPRELWLMEEGLGISWLEEDDGSNALPHLQRALETARRADPEVPVAETLYNLACAHALAGDPDAACSRLRELLVGLEAKERVSRLASIRGDRQLKSLRKTDCFKALLSSFENR